MCEYPLGGAAYLAVDGNTTTRFGADYAPHPCTCARGDPTTYWSVDLGQKYTLHDMMIYQRRKRYLFICLFLLCYSFLIF